MKQVGLIVVFNKYNLSVKRTFPNVYFYEKYINIDFKLHTWYNLTNGQAYFKRNI